MFVVVVGVLVLVLVLVRFAKKKNIHLLWMSREASMIAMFEKQVKSQQRNLESCTDLDDEYFGK